MEIKYLQAYTAVNDYMSRVNLISLLRTYIMVEDTKDAMYIALALWLSTRLEEHRALGGEIGRRITVHAQDDDPKLYIAGIMKQVSHHRDKQLCCCFSELMMTWEWTVHKREYHNRDK